MNSINGLGGLSHVQQTSSVAKSAPTEVTSAAARPTLSDRIELSGMSGLMASLKAGGDFRADKVATIKAQIEAGTYDSDDKLDAATHKLLDALGE